ncbi:MAG TPA: BNR repeat-containing protein, partial [Tepidisphaeraceae bacterium]
MKVIDVAPVWSGHSVGFCLLTRGDKQFVAYYDAERHMTVAMRSLDSDKWQFKVLPSTIGWDSHNYITMAFDDEDHLHLAGNMHVVPLVYFRASKPLDIESLEPVNKMTGANEVHCTYPTFLRGPANEFLFTYRDGHSGNGNQIYNVFDCASQSWHRMLDKPLTDGQDLANAYFNGPVRGPDGYFHLCWVWRDEGDCATNHDLSYARSKDLHNWTKADGTPLPLPLTFTNADVIDPVPIHGGIINNNTKIGFDSQKRPIVSYQKFDAAGKTQLYNARFEDGKWKIYQTSDWDYRWDFSGVGTMVFEIHVGPVHLERDGSLTEAFSHVKYGSGVWKLDEATLKPVATAKPQAAHAEELDKVESDFPGMGVRWGGDSGHAPKAGMHFELRWETLGTNRDHPREKPWPAA